MTTDTSKSASALETLKADLGRLTDEVKTLASDAVQFPQDAIFGDLARQVRREPLKSVAVPSAWGSLSVLYCGGSHPTARRISAMRSCIDR